MAHGQGGKLHPPAGEEAVAADEECVGPLACESYESRIDLAAGADVEDLDLQTDNPGSRLHVSYSGLGRRIDWVHEGGNTGGSGHQLTQKFQPRSRTPRHASEQAPDSPCAGE